MTIDPTSMLQRLSQLQFIELAAGIFVVGILLLVGSVIYFLSGRRTKPDPCPNCQLTNVVALSVDATGKQPYHCMTCGHTNRVDPLEPKDPTKTLEGSRWEEQRISSYN